MRNAFSCRALLVVFAALGCALPAAESWAVFFDLRGLSPNQNTSYSLTVGGINAILSTVPGKFVSGATTFGVDTTSALDNAALIDGGSGTKESFAISLHQYVVFDSLLISQFDTGDSGTFNIKGGVTATLANGTVNVGGMTGGGSANFLSWTGDTTSGGTRGFSLDGFTVRLLGDYNGNGTVDAGDYVSWRKKSGASVAKYSGADGDGDGIIGPGDLAVWRKAVGSPSGSGLELGSVPEPSALIVLAMGIATVAALGRPISGVPSEF